MDITNDDLPLERAFRWAREKPDVVYLTEPRAGGVETLTWRQVLDEARRVASYLGSLELEPQSRIGLVSGNTAHFIVAELAIWMAGHVTVALFPTLTAPTVERTLRHAGVELVFVGKLATWEQMRAGIPDGARLVALPQGPADVSTRWEDLLRSHEPVPGTPTRDADELAMLVYTSGTTGEPKGAMHSFGNLAACAKGFCQIHDIYPDDRVISYLPLAHVYERVLVEALSLTVGFQVFFVQSLETFVEDLKRARPTIFHSVPRLWLKFQLGVFEKLPPDKLDRLLRVPLLSRLIKRKILDGLGLGSVRVAVSGAAPIPADVLSWYRRLGLELLEGYGMSENLGYSHFSRLGRSRVGYVGEALPGVEERLGDDGEILVRSPAQMLGYFNDEAATRAAVSDDGFLRTGDRGQHDEARRLRITGRIKELFKTAKGKYVAPGPIENLLNNDPHVESACVMGVGHPQPYALVLPAPENRERVQTAEGRAALQDRLERLLAEVNAQLESYEQLAFLAVVDDEWTIENGMLTPTLKAKRARFEDRYGHREKAWYAERRSVVFDLTRAEAPAASAA